MSHRNESSLKDTEQMLKMERDHISMRITDARLKGKSAFELLKRKEEVEKQLKIVQEKMNQTYSPSIVLKEVKERQ